VVDPPKPLLFAKGTVLRRQHSGDPPAAAGTGWGGGHRSGGPVGSVGGIHRQVGTEQMRAPVGVVGTVVGVPWALWGGFAVKWAPSGCR